MYVWVCIEKATVLLGRQNPVVSNYTPLET